MALHAPTIAYSAVRTPTHARSPLLGIPRICLFHGVEAVRKRHMGAGNRSISAPRPQIYDRKTPMLPITAKTACVTITMSQSRCLHYSPRLSLGTRVSRVIQRFLAPDDVQPLSRRRCNRRYSLAIPLKRHCSTLPPAPVRLSRLHSCLPNQRRRISRASSNIRGYDLFLPRVFHLHAHFGLLYTRAHRSTS